MKYYVKRMKMLFVYWCRKLSNTHKKKTIDKIVEQNVSNQFCTKEGRRIYNYICLQCNF